MTAVEGMAKVQVNAVCSIARSLEVLGERWTFLILREAFSGVTRFADFPVGPTIVRRSRRTGRPLRVDFVDDNCRKVRYKDVEFVRTAAYPSRER